MRKLLLAVALVGAVAAATATAAFASVTFHAGPTFTDLGGGYTVNLYADASGLGSTNLTGTIVFSANVQYTCQNKGGGTAPGQPLHLNEQSSQTRKPNPKDGRAVIDLTASLTIPATVPGNEIGCPNGNWTGINPVVIGDVSATGTITWGTAQLFQQTISPVTA
jgi:hypothetical protein